MLSWRRSREAGLSDRAVVHGAAVVGWVAVSRSWWWASSAGAAEAAHESGWAVVSPVSVKFFQIDGDAVDVATVLGQALGAPVLTGSVEGSPVVPEPVEAQQRTTGSAQIDDSVGGADIEGAVIEDEPSADVFDLDPQIRVRRKLADRPTEGVVIPEGRFRDWFDVPEEHREFDATLFTCHVSRVAGDRKDVWCGNPPTMAVLRDADPRAAARVCGNCNKAIARRKTA
ncbi:MAG: hypothetical protein JWL76_2001 [Thermoleophilia bacterium]|nr:hypothetical protein [Thermoleophilia bacterium]